MASPASPAERKRQQHFRTLLVATGFAAVAFVWWVDHRSMVARIERLVENRKRWREVVPSISKWNVRRGKLSETADRTWNLINFGGMQPRDRGALSVGCMAFSQDGKTLGLAVGSTWSRSSSEVVLWDLAQRRPTAAQQAHSVCALEFSPDGLSVGIAANRLGDSNGAVELWDPTLSQRIKQIEPAGNLRSFAFSPDGQTVATASSSKPWPFGPSAEVWNVASGAVHSIFPDGSYVVAFSPDGKTLAIGHERHIPNRMLAANCISLWDVTTRKERLVFGDHVGQVTSLSFSPDCKRLVSADSFMAGSHWDQRNPELGQAKVWEVATGKLLGRLGHAFLASFSPDGSTIATGTGDGVVALWDAATLEPEATIAAHSGEVTCLAFSPDGATLATAGAAESQVKLWDVSTRRLRYAIPLDALADQDSQAAEPRIDTEWLAWGAVWAVLGCLWLAVFVRSKRNAAPAK